MTESLDAGALWALIVVLGIGTFGLRLSFIQLYAYLDGFPPALEQALGFIPAAVLAALVFPPLFPLEGGVIGTIVNVHSVAGAAAALVAWRTENMMATIAVGMGVLWGLSFL
ncbi:MAG: AzlD domain-containing protein [Halapricum sp.]